MFLLLHFQCVYIDVTLYPGQRPGLWSLRTFSPHYLNFDTLFYMFYVASVSGDYNLYPHWSKANDQFFSTNSTVSGLYWYLFFLYPFFLFT